MDWRQHGDILHPTTARQDGIHLSVCCHAEVTYARDERGETDFDSPECSDCGEALDRGD